MRTHALILGCVGLAVGSALVALLGRTHSRTSDNSAASRTAQSNPTDEAFPTEFLSESETAPDLHFAERLEREELQEPYDALDDLATEWLIRATGGRIPRSGSEGS